MAWVLDLDGVVWLADQPIVGAAAAVARLRAAGEPLAFVTNNSLPTRADVEAKLRAQGIDPGDDVVTSSMAAAELVEPGERALLVGGAGIDEALRARGVEIVTRGPADVVVVGINPNFDYQMMTVASGAIRGGARLLATNDDATYPTPDGPIPGGGAILASIVTASGVRPIVAGKPHAPIADLVRAKLGANGICVGDRPDTDGGFAVALGYRFGLVLSGVTRPSDLPVEPAPDRVTADLATMVAAELA
jgi:HAD superfamily hydrolase (TIGR01450 family)